MKGPSNEPLIDFKKLIREAGEEIAEEERPKNTIIITDEDRRAYEETLRDLEQMGPVPPPNEKEQQIADDFMRELRVRAAMDEYLNEENPPQN